ncbi:MAG: diaminopimelate decarboxylase [Actinobacteria bacterium]|nr:diaminopimelate decarboxylase [Actinomycetota bacterium]NBY15009.1 diaminopimelate decarboxylase [Actinomycetota bacterium]
MPSNQNELAPNVWPQTAARNSDGAIEVGGVSVIDLARQYQTPLYVLDEADIRSRAKAYQTAFNSGEVETEVFYAGKAFLATKVISWIASEGLSIDVCTAGELAVALKAGVSPERILFHGNNKSIDELTQAIQLGIGRIVVDSFQEILRLAAIASEHGVTAQVLIRLTVGVEAHTHEYIATAHEDQKFGISIATGAALEAAKLVIESDSLSLLGLHSHIGSQIFDADGFEIAAHRVIETAAKIRDEFDFTISELNLGGGMGIAYLAEDDPLQVAQMAHALHEIVISQCQQLNFPVPRLLIEPGRAIIGPAGITVYEVGTIKQVDVSDTQTRRYISVDGGMSDNIRTALYEAQYTAALASRTTNSMAVASRVVGKHCESGDIVIQDAQLPADIEAGDLLAVAATGAYCRAMASNYNYIVRPAVVSVCNGISEIVLRRETLADLLSLDPGAE